jgi:hypothetical protein
MSYSSSSAVEALVNLGKAADAFNDQAVLVQAEGDGALGAFLVGVAVTVAPLKKSGREEVLIALTEAGVRAVPGTSVNVATTLSLVGSFIAEHPEDPATISGAAFESAYKKIKDSLFSNSRATIGVQKARNIIAKSVDLEEAAQACIDAAPKSESFVKKVKAAIKALEAVNADIAKDLITDDSVDVLEALLGEVVAFAAEVSDEDLNELEAQHAAQLADAA